MTLNKESLVSFNPIKIQSNVKAKVQQEEEKYWLADGWEDVEIKGWLFCSQDCS